MRALTKRCRRVWDTGIGGGGPARDYVDGMKILIAVTVVALLGVGCGSGESGDPDGAIPGGDAHVRTPACEEFAAVYCEWTIACELDGTDGINYRQVCLTASDGDCSETTGEAWADAVNLFWFWTCECLEDLIAVDGCDTLGPRSCFADPDVVGTACEPA
jgi:hypothetical protein